MKTDITVILNGFKRPHYLKDQINAIKTQTIYPKEILYWQNKDNIIGHYDEDVIDQCVAAKCNHNLGVWARFAYALNAKTNWVCILDDDTIPGSRWLENCVSTYRKYPGLLGTIGLIFPNDGGYRNAYRVGWDNPNIYTTQVDIVGHAWFFHRDLLSVFWHELPPLDQSLSAGEDIHFSHMLQKYSNLKTYIPPHPRDDRELWGSLKGWEYGNDGLATAGYAIPDMEISLKTAIDNGFKLINMPSR
jgi:hypothetical protein